MNFASSSKPFVTSPVSLVYHQFRAAGVDEITNLAAEELAVENFSA